MHCIVWYLMLSYGIQFHCMLLRCWLRRAGCVLQDAHLLHILLSSTIHRTCYPNEEGSGPPPRPPPNDQSCGEPHTLSPLTPRSLSHHTLTLFASQNPLWPQIKDDNCCKENTSDFPGKMLIIWEGGMGCRLKLNCLLLQCQCQPCQEIKQNVAGATSN